MWPIPSVSQTCTLYLLIYWAYYLALNEVCYRNRLLRFRPLIDCTPVGYACKMTIYIIKIEMVVVNGNAHIYTNEWMNICFSRSFHIRKSAILSSSFSFRIYMACRTFSITPFHHCWRAEFSLAYLCTSFIYFCRLRWMFHRRFVHRALAVAQHRFCNPNLYLLRLRASGASDNFVLLGWCACCCDNGRRNKSTCGSGACSI